MASSVVGRGASPNEFSSFATSLKLFATLIPQNCELTATCRQELQLELHNIPSDPEGMQEYPRKKLKQQTHVNLKLDSLVVLDRFGELLTKAVHDCALEHIKHADLRKHGQHKHKHALKPCSCESIAGRTYVAAGIAAVGELRRQISCPEFRALQPLMQRSGRAAHRRRPALAKCRRAGFLGCSSCLAAAGGEHVQVGGRLGGRSRPTGGPRRPGGRPAAAGGRAPCDASVAWVPSALHEIPLHSARKSTQKLASLGPLGAAVIAGTHAAGWRLGGLLEAKTRRRHPPTRRSCWWRRRWRGTPLRQLPAGLAVWPSTRPPNLPIVFVFTARLADSAKLKKPCRRGCKQNPGGLLALHSDFRAGWQSLCMVQTRQMQQ